MRVNGLRAKRAANVPVVGRPPDGAEFTDVNVDPVSPLKFDHGFQHHLQFRLVLEP